MGPRTSKQIRPAGSALLTTLPHFARRLIAKYNSKETERLGMEGWKDGTGMKRVDWNECGIFSRGLMLQGVRGCCVTVLLELVYLHDTLEHVGKL